MRTVAASTRGVTAARPAPALPRVRALIARLERLAPPGLHDDEVHAWLSAPIGGEPLYRRLLEPLVGLSVASLEVEDGRVGATLVRILERRPCFGLTAVLSGRRPAPTLPDAATLVLPGDGLIEARADDVVRATLAAGRGAGGRGAVAICPLGCEEGRGPALVAIAPGVTLDAAVGARPSSETAIAFARRAGLAVSVRAGGRLRSVNTPERLRALARGAAEGALPAISPAGHREGSLLSGPGAEVARGVRAEGTVAVGGGSLVAAGARLGPGAIIGEGCYVGAGAVVEDAVLLDGCEVAPGERVQGVVRGPRRDLP